MVRTMLFYVCLVSAQLAMLNCEQQSGQKFMRALPVFQVVKFPNNPCVVTGGTKNGTCYTEDECSNLGGTNGGSCAEGYGVCCQITLGCGSSTSQNCTYFDISTSEAVAGSCSARVCKSDSNICMLRLDFTTFVITGPSTSITSIASSAHGQAGAIAGTANVITFGRCLTDTFSVSNQHNFPVICGTNTGEHAYVDASDNCNDLAFQFGPAAYDVSAVATRSISIKVSQISCHDENKPPQGCDQWYYNAAGEGYITNYNSADSKHLADQHQDICIRRERGNCQICYSADAVIDVKISHKGATAFTKSESCCGAGSKGTKTAGPDCLVIPGATTTKGLLANIYQCGGGVGVYNLADAMASPAITTASTTICSKVMPFRFTFHSNSWEFESNEATGGNVGFKLKYFQKAC